MSGAACDEIRGAAAELALGVLDGEQRARVLGHARGCAACRAHLDELAVVAQEILTAAPDHEPPPGFESRVLDALLPPAPRVARRRRRLLLPAVAATALLAAGGATWATLSATSEERRLGTNYREVLATAGGKYLVAAELRDAAGSKRGVVFAYQGDQPWVTVVLAAGAGDGPWRVAISTRAGGTVWGHALPVAVRRLADVRLTGADGRELHARFRRR
jgi:hypothetical protein